ncbi:DUF1801 domain-containing protein [Photobacterium sp. GJ3]|uniref:DUF1801 domain-containing protein n=1 Tax=Photobacterium sp. GJ3 TaxID=2829502 RepID=UPI001B8B726F|nr:DUF1801 domain-containing protein [Photobacterium sp. GJ3]QUJ68655.1 DUF1801 domain-containing protein [Photobacterium sp. GJ3]
MDRIVSQRFDDYPQDVRLKLLEIRTLIFKIADDLQLGDINESLKWGEPSYHVQSGSPIRMDWKLKSPDYFYLFFNCNTKLVDTFREIYGDVLTFQGNRAIVLNRGEAIPASVILHCLTLGMTYQKVKHLPLLGA